MTGTLARFFHGMCGQRMYGFHRRLSRRALSYQLAVRRRFWLRRSPLDQWVSGGNLSQVDLSTNPFMIGTYASVGKVVQE